MKPENRIKLLALLSELYEAGETTETILKVTLEGLTETEVFEEVDLILAETPKNYRYYEMLEEMVEEVANREDYQAKSLVNCFDDKFLLDCIKSSNVMEDYIGFCIDESNSENSAILIPPQMLTNDKKSRLEDFIQSLFPYYNEQTQIQLNF